MSTPDAPRVAPEVGGGPPPLEVVLGPADVERWAEATGDETGFHLDRDAAARQGFEGLVVHGTHVAALLAGMLLSWLGPGAAMASLSCRYRAPALAGDRLECSAVVTSVDGAPGGRLVEFDLSVTGPGGAVVTTGTARARLAP
ncbi:MAG: MaoC family dehydratase [Actinobacteria bacterium]|nr:MaoC family dehydratase [Actinomycetota bacterium]